MGVFMLRMLSSIAGVQGGDPYFSLYVESDWILLSSKGVGGGYGYLRFHARQTHLILDVIETADGRIPYASGTNVAGCFGTLAKLGEDCVPELMNRVVFESDTHECCGKIVFGKSNVSEQIESLRSILLKLQ